MSLGSSAGPWVGSPPDSSAASIWPTPDPDYLELACRYQDFSMAATDGQFNYDPVCKSGWGSSLLYLIIGRPPV